MAAPAPLYNDADLIKGAVDAAAVIPLHSFVFLDTDDLKAANVKAMVSDEAGSQAAFGPLFVGVSREAHGASDLAKTEFPVARRFVGEFDCVSAAYEIGDRVCPAWNSGDSKLENQKLKKTTVEAAAIGIVVKKTATATRVVVELISRVAPYYLHTETA